MIGGIGGIGALQLKPRNRRHRCGDEPVSGRCRADWPAADIGTTFAEALSQAASKTVGTLQNAEQVSLQALKGDADTRQVVDAVMSAQQALQTAVAIRDKVVSAYLEVSRMGI